MAFASAIKPARKARIGLYSVGLRAYWGQFPGLKDRLIEYGKSIEARMSQWGEVYNFGLVEYRGGRTPGGRMAEREQRGPRVLPRGDVFDELDGASGSSAVRRACRLPEPSADGKDQLRRYDDRRMARPLRRLSGAGVRLTLLTARASLSAS